MKQAKHDLLVLGAGPGGYVAAIRAAQLGLDVACVEKESALGGTCLRVGCIPSKALLEASHKYHEAQHELKKFGIGVSGVELDLARMMKHKDKTVTLLTKGVAGLFKGNKITRYEGHARFDGPGVVSVDGKDELTIEAGKVIVATGSKVTGLPGIEFDDDRIGDSTTALSYPEVPGHLVVIGAGVIGLELGSVWNRLGAKVTVLEYLDRILPGMDAELAKSAQKIFTKQGMDFKLGVKVTGTKVDKNKCIVESEGNDPIECDRVLVAVGRKPNTDGLDLDKAGISTTDRGVIEVDQHFRTNVENHYAIGDVIPGPMLAHKAEDEGIACVEGIVKGHGHVNYDAIPSVVYTYPEIACAGKTEEELQDAGIPYTKGTFPYMANGRARAIGATEGQVKLLAHKDTDRLLGAHILGANAGDLIAELAVAIEFSASAEDIARSTHAHPTLAEIVKEAALAVDGRAIHI